MNDTLADRRNKPAAERLYNEKRIPGFVHLSTGQEAILAGVCANIAAIDQITSTHRGHGHTIAKGGDSRSMMLDANGVVAAGMPIAVGAAHAAKLLGKSTIVACFFGGGVTADPSRC